MITPTGSQRKRDESSLTYLGLPRPANFGSRVPIAVQQGIRPGDEPNTPRKIPNPSQLNETLNVDKVRKNLFG